MPYREPTFPMMIPANTITDASRMRYSIMLCKDSKKITLWRDNLLEEGGKGGEVWGRIVYERGGFENLGETRRKGG